MKRFNYLLLGLLVATSGSAQAQINIKDSTGVSVISIYSDKSHDNGFSIGVGGMEMVFAGPRSHKSPIKTRYSGHIGAVDFGFNTLTSPDYSMYSAEEQDFLDLNNSRSIFFAVNIFKLSGAINRSHTLGWTSSIGVAWRDYVFSNDNTLERADGMIRPVAIEGNYKKSKLNTFSLYVPIMIEASFKNYFIAAGLYGDLVLGSHTKIKLPKEKMRNPYTQMFQAGLTARLGYGGFYIFGNYGLTHMFKKGKGPATKPVTLGFGLGF